MGAFYTDGFEANLDREGKHGLVQIFDDPHA